MSDPISRLERVVCRTILQRMGPDTSGELRKMSVADLLMVYGNWRARIPATAPRKAHVANRLTRSHKRREHELAVAALISKIETGADLTPHLSRRVSVAYEPSSTNKPHPQRRDLDLLVADWGIHHLHLSTTVEADGFVTRTGDLLFAAFTDTDAYLIDILPHDSWTELSLLEAIVRNWPDAGLLLGSMSGLRLVNQPSDEERRALRNAGVAQMVEIGGKVYMPAGQTTAGTPIIVSRRVQLLMHAFRDWRTETDRRLDQRRTGGSDYWQPVVVDDVCGFTNGKDFVPIGRLA